MLDVVVDGRVQRRLVRLRQQQRRLQRDRVLERPLEERLPLEDQMRPGQRGLQLEDLFCLPEQASLVIGERSFVPRDDAMTELVRLDEPRPTLWLREVDE